MYGCDSGYQDCKPKCIHYNLYNGNVNKEQYVELKEKIIGVQSENDKRITILLWAIGLILPTIGVIVGFTIHNNNKAAIQTSQETARKEFDREYKYIKVEFDKVLAEIKEKKDEIETLKFEFEQNLEIIKAANIASREINVNKNENGNTNDTDTTKA